MQSVVISGTGLYTPPHVITNEELVESYNAYADLFNEQRAADIEAGTVAAVPHSSVEFVEKASGIKQRFVMNKDGVLDPTRMRPDLPSRSDDELSIMAEMGVTAAREAIAAANIDSNDIDIVLVAASNMQRAYPAVAVEIQSALGIDGYAFDMNIACSSATFGIDIATSYIRSGAAKRVLMVNPEICSGHVDFKDRDCHFIFGDVATAVVLEQAELATSDAQFEVLDTKLKSMMSNNIRNNFGFLNACDEKSPDDRDRLFKQNGRKVFKEVCPAVAELMTAQLADNEIAAGDVGRIWLHQANINMNQLIAKKVFGEAVGSDRAPTVLDEYANTSSAGSIIAFHKHSQDLASGALGMICSFGAGYSIGSVLLQKR